MAPTAQQPLADTQAHDQEDAEVEPRDSQQVLEDAKQYWNWVTEEKALDMGYTWIAKPHAQTPSGAEAQSSGDITSMPPPPDDYAPAPPPMMILSSSRR